MSERHWICNFSIHSGNRQLLNRMILNRTFVPFQIHHSFCQFMNSSALVMTSLTSEFILDFVNLIIQQIQLFFQSNYSFTLNLHFNNFYFFLFGFFYFLQLLFQSSNFFQSLFQFFFHVLILLFLFVFLKQCNFLF